MIYKSQKKKEIWTANVRRDKVLSRKRNRNYYQRIHKMKNSFLRLVSKFQVSRSKIRLKISNLCTSFISFLLPFGKISLHLLNIESEGVQRGLGPVS